MPTITEQDIAAHHLGWAGHLPDWVPCGKDNANRKCSLCGIRAGSVRSWTLHPHWKKAR